MIVAGVDPSITGTGIAVVTGHRGMVPLTERIRTTPDDGPLLHRMRYVVAETFSTVADAEVVVIEGLSLGSKGSATRDLAGLWWMLVNALTTKERLQPRRRVAVVAPGTLKKWATGSGRATKAEVRDHVTRRWPLAGRISYDEADALALASMGLHHVGLLPWAPTSAQLDSVTVPRWDVTA